MKLTNRVLKNRAKTCTFGYPVRNQNLLDSMLAVMQRENGIGLAAPQVGVSKRVFIMKTGELIRGCFNPELLEYSQNLIEFDEGCLSFKGDSCTIMRPAEISVRYQNYRGDWYTERMSGIEARCFQHELDHLDGITMWDRYKEQHAEQS